MARRPRAARAEWEQRILASAVGTFGREGYGVSINRLIEESGAPVGTFYRLFPDKEALFARVMADLHPGYLKRVVEEVGDATDPVERLGRTIAGLVRVGAREFGDVARLYFTDVRGRGPAAAVARRVEEDELGLLLTPLREGMQAGLLSCEHPDLVAVGILGLTRRTVEAYVLGKRPLVDVGVNVGVEVAAEQAAAMVVDGLRTRRGDRGGVEVGT